MLSDPPPLAPRIVYQTHADTLHEFVNMLPGTRPEDFPYGEAAAAERVTLTTHNGTHLNAPWDFHSTMDGKLSGGIRPSMTIDEVPLDWCFQPGVKLDFRHFPDGYVATAADVEAELARIGHVLAPMEIVVVNTRAGSRYGHDDYVSAGAGMGYEATMYLLAPAQDPCSVGRLDAGGGDLRGCVRDRGLPCDRSACHFACGRMHSQLASNRLAA